MSDRRIEAADAVAELALLVRTGEEPGPEVDELVEAIERGVDDGLLPAMFAALDDNDPYGLLWPMFYLMEDLDDAYLAALVAELPGLDQRAPRWAETAVLRIVNTRGEPEDCTGAFESLVRAADEDARDTIRALLQRLIDDPDPGLSEGQRELLRATAQALVVS